MGGVLCALRADGNRLTHVPERLLVRMGRSLQELGLAENLLEELPPGVARAMPRLTALRLDGNPCMTATQHATA